MYRIGNEEVEELRKVIEGGNLFRLGDPEKGHLQEVDRFEKEWAETVGVKYALLMSGGGTAALMSALAALEIGPGDHVIIPAYTWMATATAVLSVGAIPVLAEIDDTLTLDPEDVEQRMTPHTRALLPVHMAGRPANLDKLRAIADRHHLRLVEDCAQACGGSWKGRRLGSIGDAGAFSFNDFKILSCGEGGAFVTNDRHLFDRARVYHDSLNAFLTFEGDYTCELFTGMQFRASEIMGAILRIQRQRLEGILRDLRRIRRQFHEALADAKNLRFAPDNDSEGDCGVWVAFQFDDQEAAKKFAASPAVEGLRPLDTNRHVYSNWTTILEKKIGHHPEMNPFNHPKNRALDICYTPDMCPRTLDILGRTVYIRSHPDWTDDTIAARIEACRRSGQKL